MIVNIQLIHLKGISFSFLFCLFIYLRYFSIALSILSAYDVNNMHELIINSIDDLLWVRLSQIIFPNQDLMTLNKLQKLVYNEGSKKRLINLIYLFIINETIVFY